MLGLLGAACGLDNPGDPPPDGELYFPNGLVLAESAEADAPPYLLIANSNFDLRYNAGSILALDLERLDGELEGCPYADGEPCVIDSERLVTGQAGIGSFTNGMAMSQDGRRLYINSRTVDSLQLVDVDTRAPAGDILSCPDGRCPGLAELPSGEGRTLQWPADAVAVYSGSLDDWNDPLLAPAPEGSYILTAHRAGILSLFVQLAGDSTPRLIDVNQTAASVVTGLARDPHTGLVYLTLINGAGIVERAGIAWPTTAEGKADIEHAYIFDAGPVVIEGAVRTPSVRALVFDAPPQQAPTQASPQPQGSDVLQNAFLLSSDPSALLKVELGGERAGAPVARIVAMAEVGVTPSRMAVGSVGERRVAAISCFTSRAIYVVDLVTMRVGAVVRNLSGPFDVALDGPRKRLYVGDFRSSVVRIIDLSGLEGGPVELADSAQLIATVGEPRVIQELK